MKKKLSLLVAAVIIFTAPLWAVSDSQKLENIESALPHLSDFEKTVLYYRNIKDPETGLLLNSTVGLGIGSFIEGDTVGGIIGLSGELAGASLILAGQVMVDAPVESSWSDPYTGNILKYTGLGVVGITKIYEMVRPYTYCKEFNNKLEDAFGITDIEIVPFIENDQLAATVTATMEF